MNNNSKTWKENRREATVKKIIEKVDSIALMIRKAGIYEFKEDNQGFMARVREKEIDLAVKILHIRKGRLTD